MFLLQNLLQNPKINDTINYTKPILAGQGAKLLAGGVGGSAPHGFEIGNSK